MCRLALREAPADGDEPETVWGAKLTNTEYPAGTENHAVGRGFSGR